MRFPVAPGIDAVVHLGTAADGDLCIDADPVALAARRAAIAPGPWSWLRQVHGAAVVRVSAPGDRAGEEADAAVTDVMGATLVVHTADCAPVLFWAEPGIVGVAHAGWRGLVAGVVEATVAEMVGAGAARITALLGPCISPEAYEFDGPELAEVVDRYGARVRSTTAWGRPALDLRAGVDAALAGCPEVVRAEWPGGGRPLPCTASDPGYFSWRARRDVARLAHTIVLAPADQGPETAP